MAGRLEDIPEVGNFITYNILDESIVIVRTGPDTLKAYYNVCPTGAASSSTPDDMNGVRGKPNFICGFHGWTYSTGAIQPYSTRRTGSA
jgi:phenylpropionate dioxygenase-like ring-hydroxylating dioxygenase large terminal subunit